MSLSEAQKFLTKFDTKTLYNYLLAQIVYQRPEDPRDFIAQILQQVSDRSLQFYTEEQVKLVFHRFEVLDRGYISAEQAQKAFADMGFSGIEFAGDVHEAEFWRKFQELQTQRLDVWNGGRK